MAGVSVIAGACKAISMEKRDCFALLAMTLFVTERTWDAANFLQPLTVLSATPDLFNAESNALNEAISILGSIPAPQ
jgi:hypothetical protein